MTSRPDIWQHLQEHAIPPPEEVRHRLQTILGIEGPVYDPAPGTFMKLLEGHEVAPPTKLAILIRERCGVDVPGQQRSLRSGSRIYRKWYISAAACLVLTMAGWLVYRSYTRPVSHPIPVNSSAPAPSAAVTPPVADTASKGGVKGMAVAAKPDSNSVAKNVKRPSFSVEGEAIRMSDNDILATFCNFTYPDVPRYLLREDDKPLKIYIDQYTNIYVSQNMRAMLKEIYDAPDKGKPSRKAKRARRRLEDWKERDEKRFDKKGKANPLDPLDLAEFILK